MKTPSTLTLVIVLSLLGIGWGGLQSARALSGEPAGAEQAPDAAKTPETPSEDTPTADAVAADKLIEEARSRLEDRQSLQADLIQKVTVLDRTMEAEGKYISGAPYPKLRLEYRIRVGTMQGSLLEVCDGQILHTEKTVGRVGAKDPDRQFSRRDVQRILAVRDNSLNLPIASQGADLGIGGLPALLAAIDRCMAGTKVTEEEFDGQPCRVFHGSWDPVVLQSYNKGLADAKAKLVPFFPDHTRVHFTADTYIPIKIQYLKNDLDESGKILGERVLMTLEFRNITIDAPVPPETFFYTLPPKSEEVDRTNEFLELVRQADAAFKNPGASTKTPESKK